MPLFLNELDKVYDASVFMFINLQLLQIFI